MILSHAGRYDIRDFKKFPLPMLGGVCFSGYERYVLMPISLLSWANLNHALCGFESDPVYELLHLGKWYWFWSEVYLTIVLVLVFKLNCLLIETTHAVIAMVKHNSLDGDKNKVN